MSENIGNLKGLKKLGLSGTTITVLPSSIERLMHLTSLTLFACRKLESLPNTTCGFKFRGALDLSKCSRFKNLPEKPWIIEGLDMLDLSTTAIEEMPSSIGRLTKLTALTLRFCMNLVCLPSTICSLNSLECLDLCGCSNFDNLPENIGNLKGLKELDLSGTAIKVLPSSIDGLTTLTLLILKDCKNLVCLPSTICNLKLLNSLDLFGCLKVDNLPKNIGNMEGLELLNLCWTAIKEVPSSIVLLKNLKELHIGWKLSEFYSQPASPESMEPLWNSLSCLPTSPTTERIFLPSFIYSSLQTSPFPVGLSLPSLSGPQSLTDLNLSHCVLWSIPNDIGCLSSLEYLDLSGNNFVSLPESMSQLSNLRRLCLEGCESLQSLENVPPTIDSIIADDCTSLERLPELQFYLSRSDCTYLQFLFLNCFKLIDNSMLQGVNNMLQVCLCLCLCLFVSLSLSLSKF